VEVPKVFSNLLHGRKWRPLAAAIVVAGAIFGGARALPSHDDAAKVARSSWTANTQLASAQRSSWS
jgi:hypothetical protein